MVVQKNGSDAEMVAEMNGRNRAVFSTDKDMQKKMAAMQMNVQMNCRK
jgi:hypothetical protein